MEKQIEVEVTVVSTDKIEKSVAYDMTREDNPEFIIPQGEENVNGKSRNNHEGGKKDSDEVHVP